MRLHEYFLKDPGLKFSAPFAVWTPSSCIIFFGMLHLQDGLLVEFLEILGESDVPIFSNMTADNLPDDNMVKHFFQKNI